MTKGKIRVFGFRFCIRACFLSSHVISARVFETRVSGYPLSMTFVLNLFIVFLNAALEELVWRSLSVFAFNEALLDPWWVAA